MKGTVLIGLLCMAVGMVLIPVGDSIAKYIGSVSPYSPGFMAWSRFLVGSLLAVPFAVRANSFAGLGLQFFVKQAVRAALIASTITFIITAVGLSPVADVFGAFFVGPALAVILSALLLKERATGLEWLSVVLGFVGVLMVVQPSGEMSAGLLWALLAGVLYGGFLVATRWSAGSGPPIAQLTAQLFFGFLFLLPLGLPDIIEHGVLLPLPVLSMGVTSVLANYLSILALARAGTALLAPMVYLQIVSAALIGMFFFGDQIGALAAGGLALIVFTGLLRIPVPERFQRR